MAILLVSAATGVSSDMPEGINSTGYSGRTTSAFREVACEAWSSFLTGNSVANRPRLPIGIAGGNWTCTNGHGCC